ncbi:MAG: DNRLRE domain-containing protein [Verrucomicrobiae bacterium]|nr:DNRLRE domain-containing protein [Verrucomicrobiae bacterium]
MKTSFHCNTIQKNRYVFLNSNWSKFVQSLMILGLLAVSTISLKAVELRITDDTYSGANSPSRAAVAQQLTFGGSSASRVYLKFDLSALPIPALFPPLTNYDFKVSLRLYGLSGKKIKGQVDDPAGYWDETSSALPIASGANRIFIQLTNTFTKGNFVDVDVTPLVKKWLTGESPNNGFVITPDSDSDEIAFNSKESSSGNPPTLHVEFSPEIKPGAISPDDLPIAAAAQISRTSFGVLLGPSSIVSFNPTAEVDTKGLFSAASPDHLTITDAGVYEFNVTAKWDTTGLSGAPDDSLRVDLVKITAAGPQVVASDIADPSGGVTYSRLNVMQKANVGDIFAIQVSQGASAAGPMNVDVTVSTKIIAILAAM